MMWLLGIVWTVICFLCGVGWDVIVWFIQEMPGASCCCGVFLLFAAFGLFNLVSGIFGVFGAIGELIGAIFSVIFGR